VPATDDFTVRLFNEAAGQPAFAPFFSVNVGNAVNRTPFGSNIAGFDVFEFSAVMAPIPLTAGVTYWLSIVDNTVGDPDDWLWATSHAGNARQRVTAAGPWLNGSRDLAFELTGDVQASAVPEPATIALTLTLTGLSALLARRRQR
jgi:hypothetical protein